MVSRKWFRPRNIWIAASIVVVLSVSIGYVASRDTRAPERVAFSDLLREIEGGAVTGIVMSGDTLEVRMTDGRTVASTAPAGFTANPTFAPELARQGIRVEVRTAAEPAAYSYTALFLGLAFVGVLGPGALPRDVRPHSGARDQDPRSRSRVGPRHLRRRRRRRRSEGRGRRRSSTSCANRERFTAIGGRIPKGVLLVGPPGTGKTLLARSIAGEAKVPFLFSSGSDFVEMYAGVGASRIRKLFKDARRHPSCIVFIDELDAVGRSRGGNSLSHEEREQTLNQLLVEMDGFAPNQGIVVIAATNRPDILDPALLRPGRFDRQVTVGAPDIKGREQILKIHARKVPLDPDVDLRQIARGTPGFSGADLANLMNEAALFAVRAGRKAVTAADLDEARDKVLMGVERKSLTMTEHERITCAYHESGHAVVAALLPHADPLHKVTIIPRGRALGVTMQLPEGDRHTHTREFLEAQIAILMGGRVAEELFLRQMTSGAGNDIERATEIARRMVCEFGMSALGPLAFRTPGNPWDTDRGAGISEATAQRVDEEVRALVMRGYETARQIIGEAPQRGARDGRRAARGRIAGCGRDQGGHRRDRRLAISSCQFERKSPHRRRSALRVRR